MTRRGSSSLERVLSEEGSNFSCEDSTWNLMLLFPDIKRD
jgi:hypothetical protein